MDKFDLNTGFTELAKVANTIAKHPFTQTYLDHPKREKYWEKIKQYESTQFTLTNKEIEILLLEIDAGRNTFKALKTKVPHLNSSTLSYYLIDSPQLRYDRSLSYAPALHRTIPYYFQFDTIPTDFIAPYEFKDDDCFILSISGENKLYSLKKEQQNLSLQLKSIKWAKRATILTAIGILVSITIYVLQVLGY